jgi:glycerate kinase
VSRLVAAPDKLKGTASAAQVAAAVSGGAPGGGGGGGGGRPVADGGEGILDALGGRPQHSRVHGPLGDPVDAEWRLAGRRAVIEMARASGLSLVGGAEGNDPMAASTAGTGELIAAAIAAGAREVVVGVGGSATTDGGLGAVRALGSGARVRGVKLMVACDVTTRFVDAARVFAPQKGATPAQVELLERRLARLAQLYRQEHGVDVGEMSGAGAAGGLAGGLAAIGARLVPGFDLVAEAVELADAVAEADLVVTAEGLLDEQSFHGKVVGGVAALAAEAGVPVLAVVGEVAEEAPPFPPGMVVVSLAERHGRDRALAEPLALVEAEVVAYLAERPRRRR